MLNAAKIKDLDELAQCLDKEREKGKKIVLSHGVFDLLHMGHIRHLEQARQMGDVLVVTLTQDQFVNKGPHRPAFSQALRAEAVAALEAVDYVALNKWPLAVEAIRLLKPHTYAKGQDYKVAAEDITGGITPEIEAVREAGGDIAFTDEITFSSSHLLNTYFSPFTTEVEHYLQEFRKRHSIDEVLSWVDRACAAHPLVIGEAIIDEYVFCDAIGKSTKDPVLAVIQLGFESYAGGSLAVANHLAGLCNEVRLITQLGDRERQEAFVRSALVSNVEPVLLTKKDAPTIHKRRIVDKYSNNKQLEIYLMEDRLSNAEEIQALNEALETGITDRDLTVVIDYGHGLLAPETISLLWGNAPFLALNAQSNAGNRGFNPVSKYRRADYVCLASHEVDVETRQRSGNDRDKVLSLANHITCPRFTVTRGKSGTIHYDISKGFFEAPALATQVVDRVGAGDAVFAVTSLLVKAGAPWDIVGFVGNAAGAHSVADIGNRSPIERVALSKHLIALMK